MSDNAGLEFNLDIGTTQVKIDAVVRLAQKAFTEIDPKFTVTARPNMAKQDTWDVTIEHQSNHLDYKLDEEIDEIPELSKSLSILNMVKYSKQAFYNGNPKY